MNSKFPAFPTGHDYGQINHKSYVGMSKREYFAALAMQGLSVQCFPGHHNINDENELKRKAEMAVQLADALLNELNKESK